MITEGSRLWQFMSREERALLRDGEHLIEDRNQHTIALSDYSYLVFPFAKLFEGFLKDLFLSLSIIDYRQYTSDHFRIGKALSPNLVRRLGPHSAYGQLKARFGDELPVSLWNAWKRGRNLVFHYYPHNYRSLDEREAKEVALEIVEVMSRALEVTNAKPIAPYQSKHDTGLATRSI